MDVCGAGGFAFGYWASKMAGLPEKAARTNSIEVRFLVALHHNHCLPILVSTVFGVVPCTCSLEFPCLYAYSSEQQMCVDKVFIAAVRISGGVLVVKCTLCAILCMRMFNSLASLHWCMPCLVFLDHVYRCSLPIAESTCQRCNVCAFHVTGYR